MKHYDYIEADDLYDMAIECLKNRDTDKAIVHLKKAIDLNINFTYAYIALARAQGILGEFNNAVHTLKRAAKVDTEFNRLNYLIAKYAYKGGDYKTALLSIDHALEIEENPLYQSAREIIYEKYRSRGR